MTAEQKQQIEEAKKYMTPYQLMALIVCLETHNKGKITEQE